VTPSSQPRYFTPDYVEHAALRDETPIVLRLVSPEDKAQIAAGFERMSPESRYARFFTPKTTLTDDELHYLTELDQEHHFALGALREDTGIGLGIARFIELPDLHATAEAAVAVSDEAQGLGLGKLLFMRLCAAAAERGIERFRCEVLATNTTMRTLIEHITPERSVEIGGGVLSIDMLLPNVTPTTPPARLPPASGMYALLRAAAENAVEWTDAVRRMWRRGDRT
jgi:GNAT superfamily N-acetyltransferase